MSAGAVMNRHQRRYEAKRAKKKGDRNRRKK
jgi:hypothetical protein